MINCPVGSTSSIGAEKFISASGGGKLASKYPNDALILPG